MEYLAIQQKNKIEVLNNNYTQLYTGRMQQNIYLATDQLKTHMEDSHTAKRMLIKIQ